LSLSIVARWIVVVGVLLRIFVTYRQYPASTTQLWMIALVGLLAYVLGTTFLALTKPDLQQAKWWHLFQVLADTLVFSVLYLLTGSLDSNLFLLYFLPLLTAAEHFKAREVFFLFVMISAAFVLVLVRLQLLSATHMFTVEVLVRSLLPRVTFFLYILFLVFVRTNRLKKQAETLKVLNDASEAINANLNLKDTFYSVTEYVWRLASIYTEKPPLFSCFGLLDEGHLEFKAAYPESRLNELRTRIGRIDLGSRPSGIVGRAVKTGLSQLVSDITRDPDYIAYNPGTYSQLAVPVKSGDGILGVISVEHADKHALPADLQRNVEVLAAQAATAIKNANLFRQMETRREQAEMLRQASVAMSSARGVDIAARSILEQLRNIVPYSRATLQILRGDEREMVAKHNLDDAQIDPYLLRPISRDDLIREIVEHKEICILPSPEDHPSWQPRDTTSAIKSWIGVPLVYGDSVIGLITMDRLEGESYSEDQKELLELFTSHASSVLQNAILSQRDTELIEELSQTRDGLQDLLEYLEDHRNLAIIGLVYGESIHYAKNQLGMAKTLAANIVDGYFNDDPDRLKRNASTIIKYINNYLQVLDESQRAVLPSPTKINVHILLDSVIKMKSKQIIPDVRVEREYKAAPIIYVPEQQLRQVFFVIVQNALDAMKGEGTLGLKTQMVTTDNIDYVEVSISDTGTGIPKSEQEHLFEMRGMDSSSQHRRGSGMGLVWARSFMRSYKGDIRFETSLGKGTTMHVLVPREFQISMPVEQDSGLE